MQQTLAPVGMLFYWLTVKVVTITKVNNQDQGDLDGNFHLIPATVYPNVTTLPKS